jgi:uncharacterized protein (DUF885 family)
MMEEISLAETHQIDAKVQIILRQTNYTPEIAKEKLQQFNFNEEEVIRDYFGISKKTIPEKFTSINQTIYKQLRGYLDGAMNNYRERINKGEAKKII